MQIKLSLNSTVFSTDRELNPSRVAVLIFCVQPELCTCIYYEELPYSVFEGERKEEEKQNICFP